MRANTTLLRLELCTEPIVRCSNSPLKKALCDNSSITDIQMSNHTVRNIRLYGSASVGEESIYGRDYDFIQLFMIKKSCDKYKVIRYKIFHHILTANFEISQFNNLSLSVFPELMAIMNGSAGHDHRIGKLQKIFWLVRNKEELCSNWTL